MQEVFVRFAIAGTAIVLYYGLVVGRLGPLSRPLAERLRLGRRYPLRDSSAVLNLPVAALAQALFCVALLAITGVELVPLLTRGFRPVLLLYGVLLGFGEMAVATLLCRTVIEIARVLAGRTAAPSTDGWGAIAKGGWMRYHVKTMELLPLPLAVSSVLLYVGVEELVFRGVLLSYLAPAGAPASLAASVALFVLVQAFHMPDWRAAIFPLIGALVVGIAHGALFLAVPTVLPLVVAHLVFFVSAVV